MRYTVGDRVMTPEGPGTIIEVDHIGDFYYVDLDNRTGEYSAEYFEFAEVTELEESAQ